jgi:hypothetical protein
MHRPSGLLTSKGNSFWVGEFCGVALGHPARCNPQDCLSSPPRWGPNRLTGGLLGALTGGLPGALTGAFGVDLRRADATAIWTPYPGFIDPELATAIDNVPSGKRWLCEIKFDDYRVQVHHRGAAVKVLPVAVMWGKRHGSYFY